MSIFKQRYDLEKRRRIAQDILTKFPNYVPVIVESTDKKTKQRSSRYLLDGETSVTRLIYEIRSQLNIDYHQSLFFFVHGTMLPTTLSMATIYDRYHESDGLLYINYGSESTFG